MLTSRPDTAGVAVNVSFGVIGEDRGGPTAAGGVVIDVATGFLQRQGRHVMEMRMRWRNEAKGAYLSNSRSSGCPANTKVIEFLVSKAKLTIYAASGIYGPMPTDRICRVIEASENSVCSSGCNGGERAARGGIIMAS